MNNSSHLKYIVVIILLGTIIVYQEGRLRQRDRASAVGNARNADQQRELSSQKERLGEIEARDAKYAEECRRKLGKLRDYLVSHPQYNIPELALLSDADWAEVIDSQKLNDELDVRNSLSLLRVRAKRIMGSALEDGILAHINATQGRLPYTWDDIVPYLKNDKVVNSIGRYEFATKGAPTAPRQKKILIRESATSLDEVFDCKLQVLADGSLIVREIGLAVTLPNEAVSEYMKVYPNGPFPREMEAYWPYLKTTADPAILKKIAELRNSSISK